MTRSRFAAAAVLALTSGAQADDLWRVRPGEVYDPATYCAWNRTGLPPAQQKICSDRDKQRPAYVAKWKTIEALNGAVFKVDVNSIHRFTNGGAEAVIYAVEGETFNPQGMMRWLFDCRGHYQDISGGMSPTVYAPPRSVAGQISALACGTGEPAKP